MSHDLTPRTSAALRLFVPALPCAGCNTPYCVFLQVRMNPHLQG